MLLAHGAQIRAAISDLARSLRDGLSNAAMHPGQIRGFQRKCFMPSGVLPGLALFHAMTRILMPQRQTMIAIANVATTTALSHSAFIDASCPDKAVGDSRHTQHLNFSASTTKIKKLCIVLRQAYSAMNTRVICRTSNSEKRRPLG
jgi:hypothetical protein